MKILLVTSQVTYMPENYNPLFKALLESDLPIFGLAQLDNLDAKTLKSTLGLFYLGANKVAGQLVKNITSQSWKKRQSLCEQNNKHFIRFSSMNTPKSIQWVKENQIDLILNIRTRCIYKKEILQTPKLGCLNVHHGLLPDYRGTLCDLYALEANRPAGFSIHAMVEKIDAGKIYDVVEVDNGQERDYLKYLSKTISYEAKAIKELLSLIEKKGQLPEGKNNFSEHVVFTRNPNRQKITELKQKGLIV